jgi:hypothetical protein
MLRSLFFASLCWELLVSPPSPSQISRNLEPFTIGITVLHEFSYLPVRDSLPVISSSAYYLLRVTITVGVNHKGLTMSKRWGVTLNSG